METSPNIPNSVERRICLKIPWCMLFPLRAQLTINLVYGAFTGGALFSTFLLVLVLFVQRLNQLIAEFASSSLGSRNRYRYGLRRPYGAFFSSIHPRKNQVIRTIASISKVNSVSFSVNPTSFIKGWSSVLHFTTGGNAGRLGYRIPGVFFYYNRLHICGSVSGNSNYCLNSQPLAANRWAKVRIVNSKVGTAYWYEVYVNGRRLVKVKNTRPAIYKNVRIYATDPWYAQFRGSIRNLKVNVAGSARRGNSFSGE